MEIFFSSLAYCQQVHVFGENVHRQRIFSKHSPKSEDFWKCWLLIYVWKDENGGFQICVWWCNTVMYMYVIYYRCTTTSCKNLMLRHYNEKPPFLLQKYASHTSVQYYIIKYTHLPPTLHSKFFLQVLGMVLYSSQLWWREEGGITRMLIGENNNLNIQLQVYSVCVDACAYLFLQQRKKIFAFKYIIIQIGVAGHLGTLINTFSPVRLWTASFTLAKPPNNKAGRQE